MALTRITSDEISTGAITADKISNTVSLGGPKITTVNVANSTYAVVDDTAVNVGGGYIVITGSGFESGAQVIIDTTTATSVSYINSSTLRAEVPSKSAASYNLYVVNPDGGTAIRVNGLTYSANPSWVTASPLDNWAVNVANNTTFSATGATTYSNTTALPAGTTLLSNGYFYGTVTGISVETQYTFTVRATDSENQEADKSFSVTVTVSPPFYVYTFGYNTKGQLGQNNTTNISSPVQLGSSSDWSPNVASTFYSTLFIKDNGSLWVTGENIDGQLGLNDTIDRSSPVQVGSLTNWKLLSSTLSYRFSVALKNDYSMWTWGNNSSGQLGHNNTANRSSPTQVGSGTDWRKISTGYSQLISVKSNGTLWGWGYLGEGTFGNNTTLNPGTSSPVQLAGSSSDWSEVKYAHGTQFWIGKKTNGTLWGCGYNALYNLGVGEDQPRSSPTQIGSDTTWSSFSVGRYNTLAIKTDGTLWAWGYAPNGEHGSSSSIIGTPTQIGNESLWLKAFSGYETSYLIKTNETAWVTGRGQFGGTGQNNENNYFSPVQLGSATNWKAFSGGRFNGIGVKG